MGGYLPSSVFGVIIAGRGRLSTVPFVRFIQQRGGTALYRPLCSVYTAGGDGSVPSPVFGLYNRGEQLSTVPCVFVFIHTECNRELWPNARRQQQNGIIPDAVTFNISKHQVLLVGTRGIFVFSISQLSFFLL